MEFINLKFILDTKRNEKCSGFVMMYDFFIYACIILLYFLDRNNAQITKI